MRNFIEGSVYSFSRQSFWKFFCKFLSFLFLVIILTIPLEIHLKLIPVITLRFLRYLLRQITWDLLVTLSAIPLPNCNLMQFIWKLFWITFQKINLDFFRKVPTFIFVFFDYYFDNFVWNSVEIDIGNLFGNSFRISFGKLFENCSENSWNSATYLEIWLQLPSLFFRKILLQIIR